MAGVPTLSIFISSPGDVYEERTLAQRVIERLQSEYAGRAVLDPIFWEHEPLVATADFQTQIAQPSSSDIMIAILWSRLGTRLPKDFTREDGSRYDSGTEYEFEDAVNAFQKNGKPQLLVYRKTATPSVSLEDSDALMERVAQKKKLDAFVEKWFHDAEEGTLKAAFHPFESPGDFELVMEQHLHRMIDRLLPKSQGAAEVATAVWKKGSPFRGLSTFDFEHAPIFFGRTKAIADVLDALRKQAADERAFVLVLGMSGGGKSSLARAGVMPMLTQPGVIEGVGLWRRAIFRPSDVQGSLFEGLATAILKDEGLRLPDTNVEELAEILETSPKAAIALIKASLGQDAAENASESFGSKAPEARLALLVDQMEEIFTQDWVSDEDRQKFIATLDALARCGRVWVLATMRSDLYPRCTSLPDLVALKEGNGQYDLMPPTATEIGQMVRLPTLAAALRFEEDHTTNERLDDMLRDAAAARPELLPLLQFTLQELYDRKSEDGMLTLEAYRELGGVEGSLARRAETVFEGLTAVVQAALPKALNALVHVRHDGQETVGRRRASVDDFDTPEAQQLLEAFVNARLFVTELDENDEAAVMVSHEALLWHWPRLDEWVQQNKENLRVHSRLNRAAERWIAEDRNPDLLLPSGKPLGEGKALVQQGVSLTVYEQAFLDASIARDNRFRRMKAAVVAALGVLAIAASGAALIANQQRERANVEAETARQTSDFMIGLFEVSDPSQARGESITAREILDAGSERIESELADQPSVQASLMETMGRVYTSLGLYDQATPLLQQAVDRRRTRYGERHPEVADSLGHLGRIQGFSAHYEEAEANYRDALAMQRELLEANDPEIAETLSGLAWVLHQKGEYDQSVELLNEALEIRRQAFGDSDLTIAQTLEEQGLNYYELGDYEQSESLLRQSLSMRRQILGNDPHPDVADGLSNLALVVDTKGEYEEAERLYREALDQMRVLYGENHPYVAITLNNLAFMVRDQKKYDEAEAMYLEVLRIQRDMLGENHPDVAQTLNNLAIVLWFKGDVDGSVSAFRDALAIYRGVHGDEHPEVANTTNNLGVMLVEQGQREEARAMFEDALAVRTRLLDPGHPDIAKSQVALADVLLDSEEFEESARLALEARTAFQASLGSDHWRTAVAASVEGAALTGLERYEDAETQLLQANETLMADETVQESYVQDNLERLVALYVAWDRPQDAARYRSELAGRS